MGERIYWAHFVRHAVRSLRLGDFAVGKCRSFQCQAAWRCERRAEGKLNLFVTLNEIGLIFYLYSSGSRSASCSSRPTGGALRPSTVSPRKQQPSAAADESQPGFVSVSTAVRVRCVKRERMWRSRVLVACSVAPESASPTQLHSRIVTRHVSGAAALSRCVHAGGPG